MLAVRKHTVRSLGWSSLALIALAPGLAAANPLPVTEEKQDDLTTTCGSCGSTSTGMALSYLGEKNTPDEVEHYLYARLPCGPGDDLLANAADDYCADKLGVADCAKDFNWSSYDPWELGVAQLEAGRPFVAHTNQYGGHYVLVVGMTTESGTSYVYFNDPAKGARLKWTWSEFKAIWSPKSYRGVRFLIDKPSVDAGVSSDAGASPDSAGTCEPTKLQSKGVWALGSTLRDEGPANVVATLTNRGATDLFLIIKGADGGVRFDTLDETIAARDAAKSSLRVHAWVTCFTDAKQGGWIAPSNASYRKYLIDDVLGPALSEHAIDGLSLDYVRYPGTADGDTASVTSFVQQVRAELEARRPGVILSAAVMPEGAGNAQAYGQDYAALAGPLDVLLPMTYTYNYSGGAEWVKSATSYVVGKAGAEAAVWSTLQTLNDEGGSMPGARLQGEIDAAIAGGAAGVAMFRYPVTAEQWGVLEANPIVQCAEVEPEDGGTGAEAGSVADAQGEPGDAGLGEASVGDSGAESGVFAEGSDDASGCTCSQGARAGAMDAMGAWALATVLAWGARRRRNRALFRAG